MSKSILFSVPSVFIAMMAMAANIDSSELMKSMLIVENDEGAGSGFVCNMDGEKWIVTNEHVTRGAGPLVFKTIDGGVIKGEIQRVKKADKKRAGSSKRRDGSNFIVEVAANRDLVRMPVKTDIKGLDISTNLTIGKHVRTFGNSDGGGVLTSLDGRILGIGPDRLEVDIPVVQGNSGGAIIDDNGQVVGVITYGTFRPDPGNWSKAGTRFAEVRRFGYRIDGSEWIPMTLGDYFERSRKLKELDACLDFLVESCIRPVQAHDKHRDKDFAWIKDGTIKSAISKVLKSNSEFDDAVDKTAKKLMEYRRNPGAIGNSASDVNTKYRRMLAKIQAMRDARRAAANTVYQKIKRIPLADWKAFNMMGDAERIRDTFRRLSEYMNDKAVLDFWADQFWNSYISGD